MSTINPNPCMGNREERLTALHTGGIREESAAANIQIPAFRTNTLLFPCLEEFRSLQAPLWYSIGRQFPKAKIEQRDNSRSCTGKLLFCFPNKYTYPVS